MACYAIKALLPDAMARQISMLMADELDKKVNQLAECCHCSYTEAVHHLLWRSLADTGGGDLWQAKRMREVGRSSDDIKVFINMNPDNYKTNRSR